jgi:hypothetical protein
LDVVNTQLFTKMRECVLFNGKKTSTRSENFTFANVPPDTKRLKINVKQQRESKKGYARLCALKASTRGGCQTIEVS